MTFGNVRFKNQTLLLEALAALGYTSDKVEVGYNLHLYGYHGDVRPETADIVVRRKFIDRASNDMGFVKMADGSWIPVISEYDLRSGLPLKHNVPDFVVALKTEYSKAAMLELARRHRASIRTAKSGAETTVTVRW